MRILVRLVLNWKFLEIISRCCATLSAIGCTCKPIDMWHAACICNKTIATHACATWLVRVRTNVLTATHCNTQHHTTAHCNTLQHTATHCNVCTMTRESATTYSRMCVPWGIDRGNWNVAVCCSVLQCVAVCCCVLLCVAVCCSVLQYVAVCCSVL